MVLHSPTAHSKILLLSCVSFSEPAASPRVVWLMTTEGAAFPAFQKDQVLYRLGPFGLRTLSCNVTYASTLETDRLAICSELWLWPSSWLGLLEYLLSTMPTQFAYSAS